MKTIMLEINNMARDVKIIGKIAYVKDNELLENLPVCILTEKNLKAILANLNRMSATDTAILFTNQLMEESAQKGFNVKIFKDMLNEELEHIEFLVDCGDLLIGDDSKIKEFLKEEPINNKAHKIDY